MLISYAFSGSFTSGEGPISPRTRRSSPTRSGSKKLNCRSEPRFRERRTTNQYEKAFSDYFSNVYTMTVRHHNTIELTPTFCYLNHQTTLVHWRMFVRLGPYLICSSIPTTVAYTCGRNMSSSQGMMIVSTRGVDDPSLCSFAVITRLAGDVFY